MGSNIGEVFGVLDRMRSKLQKKRTNKRTCLLSQPVQKIKEGFDFRTPAGKFPKICRKNGRRNIYFIFLFQKSVGQVVEIPVFTIGYSKVCLK
jgi:hypothetical protein